MEIKVNEQLRDITHVAYAFAPDHTCIGKLENDAQYYDLRLQIAKNNAEGYYIEWNGHTLELDSNGHCDEIDGFFDNSYETLSELVRINLFVNVERPKPKKASTLDNWYVERYADGSLGIVDKDYKHETIVFEELGGGCARLYKKTFV